MALDLELSLLGTARNPENSDHKPKKHRLVKYVAIFAGFAICTWLLQALMMVGIMSAVGNSFFIQPNQTQISEAIEVLSKNFTSLQRKIDDLDKKVDDLDKKEDDLDKKVEFLNSVGLKVPKSCQEYSELGISQNGKYMIDPDFERVGVEPFEVNCQFNIHGGTTEVSHDAINSVSIPKTCSGPSCFDLTLNYSIKLEQIKALITISDDCRQFIRFDCKSAPLENVGFWRSIDGSKQHYFYGNDSTKHACKCSKVGDECGQNLWHKMCHCDVDHPNSMAFDEGFITKKEHLPITGFSYQNLTGQANITIGMLQCHGTRKFPLNTCNGQKMIGKSTSGLYFFEDETNKDLLRVSYCDMSRTFLDEQIERKMGTVPLETGQKATSMTLGPLVSSGAGNIYVKNGACYSLVVAAIWFMINHLF